MLPLIALMAAVLIGLVALVINISYTGVVVAELQAAADAASLAGAGQYCSSKDCFENARRAAVEVLSQHIARTSLGGDSSLVIDPNHQGHVWDLSASRNLRVTIERGWIRGSQSFESMEGTWPQQHPGIPAFIAANAVSISIERPQTNILSSFFGSGTYSLAAASVALAEPIAEFCAAPFAIPVCALIDKQTGEYHGEADPLGHCGADRIFTQADRYCSGSSCDALPSIPYVACDSSFQSLYDPNQVVYFNTVDAYNTWLQQQSYANPPTFTEPGAYCHTAHGRPGFWNRSTDPEDFGWNAQHRMSEVEDHYGVVGLPRESVPSDPGLFEQEIRNVLQSSSSCEQAEVGAPFSILEDGLVEQASGDVIWDAISDMIDPTLDPNHPEYAQTMLGTIEHFGPQSSFTAMFTYQWPDRQPLFPPGSEREGICNSRRVEFTDYFGGSAEAFAKLDLKPGVSDMSHVWRRNVSVIANASSGAASCAGVNGATEEPAVDVGGEWVVIGHVEAVFFDVDVGLDPPDGSQFWGTPFNGWGFQQRCNNVRARLDCSRPFVPGDITSAQRRPILVE